MNRTLRRDLITIFILWVVLSAVGLAVTGYVIDIFPGTDSEQGTVTADAIFFLLRISVPILVLVGLIIVYAAFRFRVADNDTLPSDHQYRGARAFPWGWMSISVVLNLLFIVHPGITGLDALWAMTANADDATEIDVTAKQWEWSFDYPAQELTDVRDLVVPVGRPVRFVLRSDDVIHSFWIPAWGIKKDAVPGSTRSLVVTPTRIADTGTDPLVRVQCSQICGVGHARMQGVVRVVSLEDFGKWVDETRKAAQEEMGGMNMEGMDMGGQDGGTDMKVNEEGTGGMDMGGGGMGGMAEPAPDEQEGMSMPMAPDEGGAMPGMEGQMKMDGEKPAGGSD